MDSDERLRQLGECEAHNQEISSGRFEIHHD
jgi:hypothetical protein